MKKIGFIDYYLDEWHANNYPAWIAEVGKKLNAGFKIAYAWAELDVPPRGGITTGAWCEKYGAERCESIAELCRLSDYIVILSPDNAEKHLGYARETFKHAAGKPVVIDKTFAPTLAEAKEIFDAAEKSGVPVCSSSALRFASEISTYNGDAAGMTTYGEGSSYKTYAVHQVEMIVKCMGSAPRRVMAVQNTLNKTLVIEFDGGRRAVFNQAIGSGAPFSVSIESGKEICKNAFWSQIKSDFFKNYIGDMLRFFMTGRASVPKEDTLAVIGVIEAGEKALEQPGVWVNV
jgi:hypothetical protein